MINCLVKLTQCDETPNAQGSEYAWIIQSI